MPKCLAVFWAIKGPLPPARLLIMRFTWILSFIASLTIYTVSSIISGSSTKMSLFHYVLSPDLVTFTLGRRLADPEVIEISERPNRLSYTFQ